MKKIVTVTVEGGVIQHIACPLGVQVIMKDYDVDDAGSDLHEDENGDQYVEGVWE